MACAAGARPGRISGSRCFSVAADALTVHDLTRFERSFVFHAADAAWLPGEEAMACITGNGFRLLMPPVGEEDGSP
jgi:hypothetical protein